MKEHKEVKNGKKKAVWLTVIGIILFILALAAIYPKWNEIWYDFGRSLYYFFNS